MLVAEQDHHHQLPTWRHTDDHFWHCGPSATSVRFSGPRDRALLTWSTDLLGVHSLCLRVRGAPSAAAEWRIHHVGPELFCQAGNLEVSFAVVPGFLKDSDDAAAWEEVDPNFVHTLDAVTGARARIPRARPSFHTGLDRALHSGSSHAELATLLASAVKDVAGGADFVDVLFSGGVDSTILAALAAQQGRAVRLWNVSFAGAAAPDRLTSLLSYVALAERFPSADLAYYARDVDRAEHDAVSAKIMRAVFPKTSLMDFTIGSTLYFASQLRGRRISLEAAHRLVGRAQLADLEVVKDLCCRPRAPPKAPRVSGDCGDCGKYAAKSDCVSLACRGCCKKRGWAAVDYRCVPHQVNRAGAPAPASLVAQLEALWPAVYASSEECCGGDDCVALCGNGADELFGGYSRYSTAEMHGSLAAWRGEMVRDLERLWLRNFSRDCRVVLIGSGGRTVCRSPFFQPAVIAWVADVSNADLWHGLSGAEQFANNKALLREMCAMELGLAAPARFRKRAMQFGSRSATSIFTDSTRSRRSVKGTAEWKNSVNDDAEKGFSL